MTRYKKVGANNSDFDNGLSEYLSGFYETAGKSQGFSFVGRFFFSRSCIHSSRRFYPHSDEP